MAAAAGRVSDRRAGEDQLHGLHGAAPPHVADGRELRLQGVEAFGDHRPDPAGGPGQSHARHGLDGRQGGRAGNRVAAERPAKPTACTSTSYRPGR